MEDGSHYAPNGVDVWLRHAKCVESINDTVEVLLVLWSKRTILHVCILFEVTLQVKTGQQLFTRRSQQLEEDVKVALAGMLCYHSRL